MDKKQHSVENTLYAIRALMKDSIKSSKDDVLELTEDDLVDELDEDAYENYLKTKKSFAVNEILTQLPHANSKSHSLEEEFASADNAAQSIEAIKNLIKKAEESLKTSQLNKSNSLDEIVMQALKPLLNEWIDKNLQVIVEKSIKKELERLITQQDKKND